MKHDADKLLGEKRRKQILKWLKESSEPITGGALAERTNVSRQVIVQDISLIRAKNEPIVATSQGYVYLHNSSATDRKKRVIASCHTLERTEEELTTLVDNGVTVLDVIVEHPVYGELTASLMLRNRRDVQHFMQKMKETKATLLADLTEGVHLHTLEADSEEQLDEVCELLAKKGFLLTK
jgi:uncharacterized protein